MLTTFIIHSVRLRSLTTNECIDISNDIYALSLFEKSYRAGKMEIVKSAIRLHIFRN